MISCLLLGWAEYNSTMAYREFSVFKVARFLREAKKTDLNGTSKKQLWLIGVGS